MVYLEAEVTRVSCPEHGVVVAHVPWARPKARHTYAFEDMVAWWTARAASSTVAEFMRITWRSVQAIVERVVTELAGRNDLLSGLRRIGIDEISYRKGQRYLCVVDHDTDRGIDAANRGQVARGGAVPGSPKPKAGAARPLIQQMRAERPDRELVVSRPPLLRGGRRR
jgi:transposase